MVVIIGILLLNFLSEIAHGILTATFGTDQYAVFSVGELVKGPILAFLVAHAVWHIHYIRNRLALAALFGLVFMVFLQALLFSYIPQEVLGTLTLGIRWLYLFLMANFISIYMTKHRLAPVSVLSAIKWMIVIFYCIPIFLAAAGIMGYSRGDRQGYFGLVMNQNAVAIVFVAMLPFYLDCRRLLDYFLLACLVTAGVLLASSLVYMGFAIALSVFLILKTFKMLRTMRIRRIAVAVWASLIAIVLILPFTSVLNLLIGIYEKLEIRINFLMSNFGGSFIDAVSGFRTYNIYRYLAWAQEPNNLLQVLIGGGARNYQILYSEVDWVDLMALFGVIGTVVLYGMLAFLLLLVYRTERRPFRIETFAMLLFTIGGSLTAGHALNNPAATIIIGCVLGIYFGPYLRRNATQHLDRSEEVSKHLADLATEPRYNRQTFSALDTA